MNKAFITLLLACLLTMNLLYAQPVHAVACVNNVQDANPQICNPINYAPDAKTFIYRLIQVLATFFFVVPVIRVCVAGFRMVMSQGNSEAIAEAKKALQWTVFGVILAMFSFVLVQALANYMGVIEIGSDKYQGNPDVVNPITVNSFGQLLVRMISGFLGVAGLFAILMIILGGFRYITSAGNEEQTEEAKGTLQWAIIGLVVIIFAYVIIRATLTFFGG